MSFVNVLLNCISGWGSVLEISIDCIYEMEYNMMYFKEYILKNNEKKIREMKNKNKNKK